MGDTDTSVIHVHSLSSPDCSPVSWRLISAEKLGTVQKSRVVFPVAASLRHAITFCVLCPVKAEAAQIKIPKPCLPQWMNSAFLTLSYCMLILASVMSIKGKQTAELTSKVRRLLCLSKLMLAPDILGKKYFSLKMKYLNFESYNWTYKSGTLIIHFTKSIYDYQYDNMALTKLLSVDFQLLISKHSLKYCRTWT